MFGYANTGPCFIYSLIYSNIFCPFVYNERVCSFPGNSYFQDLLKNMWELEDTHIIIRVPQYIELEHFNYHYKVCKSIWKTQFRDLWLFVL